MAAGVINLQKASGGVTKITSVDGTGITNLVVPESGVLATISNLIGKNLLINANFLVNQRGYVSGTNTTAANQYCHDRWRVVTSGQNVTFTKTANVVTVTAPAGGYEQIIEDINVHSGDYKISHEGTATVSVAESTDNITYTTLSPNANGTYTLTGGKYVRVRFSSGTIIKPQVELGSVRTPFENRPYGLELSLCQRYWESVPFQLSESASTNGGTPAYYAYFKQPKRNSPTVAEVNSASGGVSNCVIVGYIEGAAIQIYVNSSSWYRAGQIKASAEL